MDTNKLKFQLNDLTKNTINFEMVAIQVFNRLILGDGPGLLVLYGPPHETPYPGEKKGNKGYFLNVVEAFQQGCPSIVKDFVSTELWSLLSLLRPDMYQCVKIINIIKEFNLDPHTHSYRVPLGVTTSVAMAIAAQENGLEKGQKVVFLCDDLHEFMGYNKEANEQFLKELSCILDNRKEITFLAAARLRKDPYWAMLLGSEHILNLGWD